MDKNYNPRKRHIKLGPLAPPPSSDTYALWVNRCDPLSTLV